MDRKRLTVGEPFDTDETRLRVQISPRLPAAGELLPRESAWSRLGFGLAPTCVLNEDQMSSGAQSISLSFPVPQPA